MPKKKTKQFSNKSQVIMIIVLAAILALISFFYPQWRQERNFKELEAGLNKIEESIKSKNQSISITRAKFCKKDGVKFGGGQLRCFVNLEINSSDKDGTIKLLTAAFEKDQAWAVVSLSDIRRPLNESVYEHLSSGIKCEVSSSDELIDVMCFKAVGRPVY